MQDVWKVTNKYKKIYIINKNKENIADCGALVLFRKQ